MAIRAIDPASLPVPPEELISLLGLIARNDIDTTGDGNPDTKLMGFLTGVVGD